MKYSENEQINFQNALNRYLSSEHKRFNIGTYKESSLHMLLKYFISPDKSTHEVSINGHIADVFCDNTVYEIQTASFGRLKDKLASFLPDYKVTVIYPVCVKKQICRINSETGEIISKRISPLKGKPTDIFSEICYIKDFLSNKNLSFYIFYYNGEQFRFDSKSIKVGKKMTDKYDTVPTEYIGFDILSGKDDYLEFIPVELPFEFTLKEYISCSGYRRITASSILYASHHAGALIKGNKRGREYLYKRYYSEI